VIYDDSGESMEPAVQQSIYISYHYPPGPQQQTRRTLLQRTNGTDRRTDTVPFRGPCSAYYAGSINNHDYGLTGITTSSDVWRRVQEVGAVFSEWPQLLLAYDVVWAALSLFVPLVILVACNVCLLRALRQSRQLQRRCRADVRPSTA